VDAGRQGHCRSSRVAANGRRRRPNCLRRRRAAGVVQILTSSGERPDPHEEDWPEAMTELLRGAVARRSGRGEE
jgi:hypothetical protein